MSAKDHTAIRSYSVTGTDSKTILNNALSILRPHLPVSLPLYRRLQFGRFFNATTLLSNLSLDSTSPGHSNDPSTWLIAFVDRSCRPETEVYIAASWEVPDTKESDQSVAKDLLRNLVQTMKDLPIPTSIHEDLTNGETKSSENLATDHAGLSIKDYGGHAADPNIMLWGATHEKTVHIMKELGVLSFKYKSGLIPNYTFVWDVDTLPAARGLPEGLRWGQLSPEHFELVKSRTQIPRQDRTMAILPNLGIFPQDSDSPISWAFVGLDSSLTTLHVESEYRGKGLAKTITTKLFKEKMDIFWEDGVKRWSHGYVIAGNAESEGMCRSLGGKSDWDVYWLRVDLAALEAETLP